MHLNWGMGSRLRCVHGFIIIIRIRGSRACVGDYLVICVGDYLAICVVELPLQV